MTEKGSVSVVVGCMGRGAFLAQALPSWLACPEVAEVVVVDWNSAPPVAEALASVRDSRVRILRVVEAERWVLSLALNFGARAARAPLLLKADADTVLRPGFFAAHPLAADSRVFYSGNWERARDENERHLNGVVFLPRAAFQAANGYNEWLRSYGWDDTDLYLRLRAAGLAQRDLAPDFLEHLPHPGGLRSAAADLRLLILTNKYLAKARPWGAEPPTEFVQVAFPAPAGHEGREGPGAEGEWVAVDPGRYEPPGPEVDRCRACALRDALAQAGHGWALTQGRSPRALQKLYHWRARPRVVLDALNGLGNRLRALASAAVIAEAAGRPLVLVWRRTPHCDAPFGSLFADEDLFCAAGWPSQPAPVGHEGSEGEGSAPPGAGAGRGSFDPAGDPFVLEEAAETFVASACALRHAATGWRKETEWLRRHLAPRPAIAARIAAEARRISAAAAQADGHWAMPDVIGLQVRMGQEPAQHAYEDMSGWAPDRRDAGARARAQSHYSHFLWAAEALWRRRPEQRFLLCADTAETYAAFEARHPDRVGRTLFWTAKDVWDRSAAQLEGAVVDVYLLAACRELWGSPWSSFTELAARLARPGTPLRYAGKDFAGPRYGVLCNPGSRNLGDDIQNLAAARLLPAPPTVFLDRDDQAGALAAAGVPGAPPVAVIENGWFDGRFTAWPPPPGLRPVFVSFHINEGAALFDDPRYRACREPGADPPTMLSAAGAAYFRRHGPVGTRDLHTLGLLRAAGVAAYHTGCLTLTLGDLPALPRGAEALVVDADIDAPALFERLVPAGVRAGARYLRHGTAELLPAPEKARRVAELLDLYRRARLVVTSRLHCALPCLAFGTPFVWLLPGMASDPRFDATMHVLLGDGQSLPDGWDWDAPALAEPRRALAAALARVLRERVRAGLAAAEAEAWAPAEARDPAAAAPGQRCAAPRDGAH